MRKTLIILATVVILLSSLCYAIGDKDYSKIKSNLDLWSKIKLTLLNGFGNPFTVISGATCSINPDLSGDISLDNWVYQPSGVYYVSNTNSVCYHNTEHTGVAFQLFSTTSTGWHFIGEKQITRNQIGCFNGLTGNNYHYDLYFCDAEERECVKQTGRDYYTKGTLTYDYGNLKGSITDECETSQILHEYYCDKDNSVASVSIKCENGCVDGACLSSPDDSADEQDTCVPKYYNEYKCYNKDVYRKHLKEDCNIDWVIVKTCSEKCVDGKCVCTPVKLDKYQCIVDDLYQKIKDENCIEKWEKVKTCQYGCKNGECLKPEENNDNSSKPITKSWWQRIIEWIINLFK